MICVLKEMGEDCDGEPKERNWFGHLKAPICDKHYKDNLILLALHKNGINIGDILNLTLSERKNKLDEIVEQSGKTIEVILDEAYQYEQNFKI